MRTYIERVPSTDNAKALSALDAARALRRAGWSVSVLHSYAERSLIVVGCADDSAPSADDALSAALPLRLFDSPDA